METSRGLSAKAAVKLLEEKARASWQWRAIAHTRAGKTVLGSILVAALKEQTPENTRPRIVCPYAWIDDTGYVWTFVQKELHGPSECEPVALCTTLALKDSLLLLADALKFNDAERVEMFQEVQKWIAKDYRALATDENGEPRDRQYVALP